VAALSVAPTLHRLGWYFLADPKHYVTAETMVRFLRELLKQLRGRIIVVWDGGSSHKGPLIRALCARHILGCTSNGCLPTRRTSTRWRCSGVT
jgi:hypothetical protein